MINTYIVQPNENIFDIANKLNMDVEVLKKANKNDLSNLSAGQIINIPDDENNNFVYYQARNGDTLSELSRKINMPLNNFAKINGLFNTDYIFPGQVLMIPKPGVKVYLTGEFESLNDVAQKLNTNISDLLKNNKNIYLSKEQLLIYK